jgi:hypothetical protein
VPRPPAFALALVLAASALTPARAQEGTAVTPTAASAGAGTSGADYPDISAYLGKEEELIARATAARATVTADLERVKANATKEQVDGLKRRDEELDRAIQALRGIASFGAELKDLASWREKLESRARELSTLDEELRQARLDPHPALGAPDKVKAEQELERLTRERETLKARIRTVPKLVDEKRAERAKHLDELAAIDPDAQRGTAEGARRWALRIVLAYLDRFIPFLLERQAVWERRLALDAQEADYWDSRLRFVDSVMSGRHAARVAIYQKLEAIGRALDEKARAAALLQTDSPAHAKLLDEMKELGQQKFLAKQEFDALEEQDRLETATRERRGLEQQLEAAQAEHGKGKEVAELRAEAERARKEAERQREVARKHAADIEAQRRKFEDEIASSARDLAALEAKPGASADEKARAAALRARVAELREQEVRALGIESQLLRSEEDAAALKEKLAESSAAQLERAVEKSGLFLRQDQDVSVAALEEAGRRAAGDAKALALALEEGEPWRGRSPLLAVAVALAAATALYLHVKLGRLIDRIGRANG